MVFDEETGRLLGFSGYSDAPELPCDTSSIVGGEVFDCASVTTCDLNPGADGTASNSAPACD